MSYKENPRGCTLYQYQQKSELHLRDLRSELRWLLMSKSINNL